MKSLFIPLTIVLALSASVFLGGCAIGYNTATVPAGLFYGNVRYPSSYHGESPQGPGPKRGVSSAYGILGLVAFGDASVETAARKATIKQIKTVDQEYTMILSGLYVAYETIVTGE